MKMIVPVRLSVRRRVRQPGVARLRSSAGTSFNLNSRRDREFTSTLYTPELQRQQLAAASLTPCCFLAHPPHRPRITLYTTHIPSLTGLPSPNHTRRRRSVLQHPRKLSANRTHGCCTCIHCAPTRPSSIKSLTLNGPTASFPAARVLASIHSERRHPAFRSCPRGQASRP